MRYRFDDFTLDTARRELTRGGRAIAVEPQVFDLLQYLIESRERVVTRDDLIAHVWGGRIVSESTLATRINAARKAVGDDGARQALIKTVMRKGVRFVGEVREENAASAAPALPAQQDIRFCRAADGVSIAYAAAGEGPVLLRTSSWLNHLAYDVESPVWAPLIAHLARRFRYLRYDGRGAGLSDRDAADLSFAGFLHDLEAVAATAPQGKLALFGMSQGAAAAIAYAVRHPERVSHLIVYGGYALGRNRRGDPADRDKAQAILAMMRQGWGDEGSAFMRAFSSIYLPNGTSEQIGWFAQMQRAATSGEIAARLRNAADDIDVVDLLPQVAVPTLVLHARQDHVTPIDQGRRIAAAIPGARFFTLESENHVPLPGEASWEQLMREIEGFVLGG